MKPHYFKGRLKPLLLLALATLFSATQVAAFGVNSPPAEWTLLTEKDGISVSYKVEECMGGQRVLFQIQNQTSTDIVVDFECKIKTKSKEIFIPSVKNTVAARSAVTGTCSDKPFQSTFISLPKQSAFEAIHVILK